MFTIPIVKKCPHTVATGQLRLSHKVIAALAGAVHDKEEWMAILCGTRSKDGLITTVTSVKVPEHYRSYGAVELIRPEPLTPDMVGVVHSHHVFQAFFSHVDYTELNTRFPVSLVVAHSRDSSTDTNYALGFDYKAEGKVTLPCGQVGNVDFLVVPHPIPKGWTPVTPANFTHPNTDQMGECKQYTVKKAGIQEKITTACGLFFTQALPAIFGTEDQLIMPEVLKKSQPTPVRVNMNWNRGGWGSEFGEYGDIWHDVDRTDRKDARQPNGDQWGYWGIDGKYHRYEDQPTHTPLFDTTQQTQHRPVGMGKREWKRLKKSFLHGLAVIPEKDTGMPDFDNTGVMSICTECQFKKSNWAMWMNFDDRSGVCMVCKPGYLERIARRSESTP